MSEFDMTFCETMAAISWHVRRLTDGEEPNYNGYKGEQPTALCGMRTAWDIRQDVNIPNLKHRGICKECTKHAKELLDV